ncbi:carboxymuconolactone decarboxylase family protein [Amycolatopsis sp. NPDC059027]|uniref:carboxymuconolactone decarboxylase family protein n=1 Tax=unclassified Amycolatopsis TaxID=2618356 RepID=UPI00366CCD78
MSTSDTEPRIAPAPPEEIRPLLGGLLGGLDATEAPAAAHHITANPVLNVLATVGNHPGLLTGLAPLLGAISTGLLPARDRELVILRVAWHTRARYEWAHHVVIAGGTGLTEQEIARIPHGQGEPGWSDLDAALLRAVDELHGPRAAVSDRTWQQLAAHYDHRQLLELLALTGTYTLVAYVLNSCRVPIDDWLGDPAPLPEVHARRPPSTDSAIPVT